METNHENIIRSLNQYMARKAEVQIKLNETRDTLRETNSIVRIFLIKNKVDPFTLKHHTFPFDHNFPKKVIKK
jgi:hypothetical protein